MSMLLQAGGIFLDAAVVFAAFPFSSQPFLALHHLITPGPHPASVPGPSASDRQAQWSRVAYPSTLQLLLLDLGALSTYFHLSSVSEQIMPIIYFIFFNTLCYGCCFVASDTLVLCYMFLLKLAAPAALRVSLVVSLESGVYCLLIRMFKVLQLLCGFLGVCCFLWGDFGCFLFLVLVLFFFWFGLVRFFYCYNIEL